MGEDINQPDLPDITDKFDVKSAEHIVIVGYPENKERLESLIFWSCFPNDMVCWITYPYIDALRDDILAPPMASFLDFNINAEQLDLVAIVFGEFINPRGQEFRLFVKGHTRSDTTKALFSDPKYAIKV